MQNYSKNIHSFEYAIGFVVYYPEPAFFKRVIEIIELGYKVYIFDNSPFNSSSNEILQDGKTISYITAGKNVGLGYSMSTVCATAYAQGYKNLLFLDQDTAISRKTLEFISNSFKSIDFQFMGQYAALVFTGNMSAGKLINNVRLAINSGSVYNLKILKKIGWFNVEFFVDGVDYEFCLRARRNGFKIGLINNAPDFDHVTEQPDRAIEILGKKILVRRYSFIRIKDALGAYVKLIIGGIYKNNIFDTLALVKSMSIYVGSQIISRFIAEKK